MNAYSSGPDPSALSIRFLSTPSVRAGDGNGSPPPPLDYRTGTIGGGRLFVCVFPMSSVHITKLGLTLESGKMSVASLCVLHIPTYFLGYSGFVGIWV